MREAHSLFSVWIEEAPATSSANLIQGSWQGKVCVPRTEILKLLLFPSCLILSLQSFHCFHGFIPFHHYFCPSLFFLLLQSSIQPKKMNKKNNCDSEKKKKKKKKTQNCHVWDPGESLINFHFHRLVPSLAWFSKCMNKSGHALDLLAALEKKKWTSPSLFLTRIVSWNARTMVPGTRGPDSAAGDLGHRTIPRVGTFMDFRKQPPNTKSITLQTKASFLCFCLLCLFLDPWLLPMLYAENTDSEKNKVADRYKG